MQSNKKKLLRSEKELTRLYAQKNTPFFQVSSAPTQLKTKPQNNLNLKKEIVKSFVITFVLFLAQLMLYLLQRT